MVATDTPELIAATPTELAEENIRFVGSKGGAGIAQWLISQMPPHTHYVECCLGRGKVYDKKLAASVNIGIESDAETLREFWFGRDRGDIEIICGDCLEYLPRLDLPQSALVYADPPYLRSACQDTTRRYYRHDRPDPEWHGRLLDVLTSLRCMVIVSGYESELYHTRLAHWRTAYKWTVNRGGAAVKEVCWMNFEQPVLLHDSRYVGDNYTDRQRVKRKMERWKKNFLALPADERWAMFAALSSVVDDGMPALLEKPQPEQTTLI